MMQGKKKVKGRRGGDGSIKKKSNTKTIVVVLALLILLISVLVIVKPQPQKPEWSVSGNGMLSYPSNRGAVAYTVNESENNMSYTVEKIEYASRDANITAILRIPKSDKKVPAVILIPGAGVTAERMRGMAMTLSSMGYASLAIDKRAPSISSIVVLQDYQYFKEGKEPIEHKMVWDVLRAYDLLKGRSGIDGIAVLGESEGGRIAIISAALEPGIKGMIGVSAYGDDSINNTANYNQTQIRFIKSIDPDEYIGLISPRRVVMFHDVNDTIIDFAIAERTFAQAKQPKEFYKVSCDTPPYHGFCSAMEENFTAELVKIFA